MGAQPGGEVNRRKVGAGRSGQGCCACDPGGNGTETGNSGRGRGRILKESNDHRLIAVDLARSLALLGMVVFHFTFDLELFGHLAPGTTTTGGWAVFARLVAGSFLFLAGVSLVLAHGAGRRWGAFRRRLLRVVGAALVVTGATLAVLPQAFIFFGILHSIAFASLVGMALIGLRWQVLAGLAVAVVVADRTLALDAFNPLWLVWTGLGTRVPWSMDFVPVFPWLAAFLAGMAMAQWMTRRGLWARLARMQAGPVLCRLAWPGRHSLPIYLIHQPILMALVWLATWAMG